MSSFLRFQFRKAIVKFKYPAKVTQIIYGIRRYPAGFEMRQNASVVERTKIKSATSHTKEKLYVCRLKNRIDQKKLKNN